VHLNEERIEINKNTGMAPHHRGLPSRARWLSVKSNINRCFGVHGGIEGGGSCCLKRGKSDGGSREERLFGMVTVGKGKKRHSLAIGTPVKKAPGPRGEEKGE